MPDRPTRSGARLRGINNYGLCSVAAQEFLASAEAFAVERPIDRENAVEVIDLVLEEFGKRVARFQADEFVRFVQIADAHRDGALQADQQVREREAIVPELEF